MMKKEASAERPKRLSLKDLDEKIARLTALVEKAVNVADGHQVKQVEELKVEPPAEPMKELPPLVKGNTYMFFAGIHKGMMLRLQPGRRTDYNQITGEYELIPPEFADFGAQDEGTGPKGYYVTKDLEEVKKIRKALSKVKTREIIEVTGDPAFEELARI